MIHHGPSLGESRLFKKMKLNARLLEGRLRKERLLPVHVSDVWSYVHYSSQSHWYATATIADLLSCLANGRLTATELLDIFHNRRMLCRGCKGLQGYENSPFVFKGSYNSTDRRDGTQISLNLAKETKQSYRILSCLVEPPQPMLSATTHFIPTAFSHI